MGEGAGIRLAKRVLPPLYSSPISKAITALSPCKRMEVIFGLASPVVRSL